jgi:four helix bundle protein
LNLISCIYVMAHNFKQLKVWQKGMDLTDMIFEYNKGIPKEERYNLIDQMNRSSCSIVSNIAEGSGKRSKLEFAQFLSTALSSSYELETQLLICERRNYGDAVLRQTAINNTIEIQKMIFVFREKVVNDNVLALES